MNELNAVNEVIKFIQDIRQEIQKEWKAKFGIFQQYNYKKRTIYDLVNDGKIFLCVICYQQFLNEATIKLVESFSCLDIQQWCDGKINTRVKTPNSITQKIYTYYNGKLNGKMPINKCLNDLFGIRFILSYNLSVDDMIKHISQTFPKLKCIDASKEAGYKAIHVYFADNNSEFPWELQIWHSLDEIRNIELHKIYKQDYTSWEKDSKGGEI